MAAHNADPEKVFGSSTARSMMPVWSPSATANGVKEVARQTSLELFQLLVGIHTPPPLTQDGADVGRAVGTDSKGARTDNIGLYQRAKERERTARIAYLCTSYISNILYLFQVLLAATFTALSAYKDVSSIALTVLGALNTVLAGCLAWNKGQGIPQRYRKAQDQYQALVLEIEMTERGFLCAEESGANSNIKLDPRRERDRLQKMYDEARADQQANYPDLYVSTGAATARATKDLTKQLEDARAEAAKVQSELMANIEALMRKLEGKADARILDAVDRVAEPLRT